MQTFHIHIKGRVQGVGFRPFVYKLAKARGLQGWVCNATDGVHIRLTTSKKKATSFYDRCIKLKPHLAVITSSSMQEVEQEFFVDFKITESESRNLELSITPDFAICPSCLKELQDAQDRRHTYPFITCTQCGPRYSIMRRLPYDRPFTAMDAFEMCPECETEYHDPLDKRYFSQTNSCDSCGIRMSLYNEQGLISNDFDSSEILSFTVQKLKENCIIALKGIGGFLLLCNAENKEVVAQLRARKHRPSKPFAVLYPSVDAIKQAFDISDGEQRMLQGPVSPIVLLAPKAKNSLAVNQIAPGLDRIGVMVPYAPVLALVASQFDGPLIATSANLSGAPIVHAGDESRLFALADYIVTNNRPILFPQDDSVVQFTSENKKEVILRRARGLAPSVFSSLRNPGSEVLALGAEMKGAFGLSVKSNTYVSQYLGNLIHYENQIQFEEVLQKFMELVEAVPEKVVVDKHPAYFTSQLGRSLAEQREIPIVEVQHHEAHFASLLAERELMNDEHILGIVWDGTGYGSDGHSWGGEFFEYSNHEIRRLAHLAYFPNLSNDRMAVDGRLCALSLAGETYRQALKDAFNSTEWGFYTKSLQRPNRLTSSIGRLFDAFAFLAGLSQRNDYEGQSAMLLEQQARHFLSQSNLPKPYTFDLTGDQLSILPALDEVFHERQKGYLGIAARIHVTLVEMVRAVASRGAYQKLAFSGGVFQNGLLVDLLINQLGDDFELYFHQELSPNDENIAFGQLAHVQYIQNRENSNLKSVEQCV